LAADTVERLCPDQVVLFVMNGVSPVLANLKRSTMRGRENVEMLTGGPTEDCSRCGHGLANVVSRAESVTRTPRG
jgi:hypothetical protein